MLFDTKGHNFERAIIMLNVEGNTLFARTAESRCPDFET